MSFEPWDENNDGRQKFARSNPRLFAGLSPQTMVMTRSGEAPVEWLETGDEVLTRDRGFVPILLVQRTKLERSKLRQRPDLAPVVINASFIQDDFPDREIVVAPNQLVLIRSAFAEMHFATNEVLVPAVAIGTQRNADDLSPNERVSYAHILLPTHQMIVADRVWLGSLFCGDVQTQVDTLDSPILSRLERPRMHAARPILNVAEGRMLMQCILADRARRALKPQAEVKRAVG